MEISLIDITIIEDSRALRRSLIETLTTDPRVRILGDFESCEEAFEDYKTFSSDIVLMDISLPGMNGIEGVKHLVAKNPNILTIMLTVHEEDEFIFNAVKYGAVGYLLKSITPEELIKSIYDALKGGSPMTPKIARKVLQTFQQPLTKAVSEVKLTDRETEILNLLSNGKSYKTISSDLTITTHTISYHLRNIYDKLHVRSRSEAVYEAQKKKLI